VAPTAAPKRASGDRKKSGSGSASNGKPASNGAGTKKAAKKSVKSAAGGAAAKSALTTRPGGNVRLKAAGAAVKAAATRASEKAKDVLPALSDGSALELVRDAKWDVLTDRVRTVPVQRSVDVAVPIEAAWDEWMRFDWLPDGAGRVQDIERDDDVLYGRVTGSRFSRDWEAEIVDERMDESLAWQTVEGSDTSGLVTFHRLSERLTRIELQLDIVPEGMGEALSLVLRRADRRADTVLRSFKAQVEALDPDEYPDVAEVEEDDEEAEEADE
jgi:uncharacterized membrane protein